MTDNMHQRSKQSNIATEIEFISFYFIQKTVVKFYEQLYTYIFGYKMSSLTSKSEALQLLKICTEAIYSRARTSLGPLKFVLVPGLEANRGSFGMSFRSAIK